MQVERAFEGRFNAAEVKCKSYWGAVLVFSPERPALMMAANHAY